MTVANGAMLWFHEEKGYGFIQTDDGERVYVERAGFVDGVAPVGRCAGLAVALRVVVQSTCRWWKRCRRGVRDGAHVERAARMLRTDCPLRDLS